ncbi:HNH endonuclease [Clostridium estertheticum]|uniref:RNA-guided endonuclease IscB n=1 Tax=Clostridium estertheticum TaxID=238834 RepID=UPI001CD14217|nr:RNA-guided endonuclease IscB [Clostridium estertheticum]MBZ9686934.1 HNH endonuclease [Clostridium estertheticum]
MVEYSFVVDLAGNRLSPCNKNKSYYLIRKNKAKMLNKFPMVIQLQKIVNDDNNDDVKNYLGIDDGSKNVGLGIIQQCNTKVKTIFKGTIELRQDVSKKMTIRKGYRMYHRYHKRYRKKRFDNRRTSKRENRLAPTILQKKQSILRVVNKLLKWTKIDAIYLEDVLIDIRAMVEGKALYKWQYQKSNRLDNNIRLAVFMRDNFKCVDCNSNVKLQMHHAKPKNSGGADSIYNGVTLCEKCHIKTFGKELQMMDEYLTKIKGKNLCLRHPMHVMQGKKYLQVELEKIAPLSLTTGADTANHRIDWNIEKSHSNDALVICGTEIKSTDINIKDWHIKPLRKKSKGDAETIVDGFKLRDYVKYTKRNGVCYIGYITALYPDRKQFNMTTKDNIILKRYGLKSLNLISRPNSIRFS